MSKHFESEPDKEREGLISGDYNKEEIDEVLDEGRGWSRRALVIASLSFIGLLLFASLLPPLLGYHSRGHVASSSIDEKTMDFAQGEALRSNGTHNFKRTVLMVSIDGLRADYLDRGLTPHLLEISRTGLRAEWMRPVFPTLTFPNHWSILTGLYAESHGIVANTFWDAETGAPFSYSDPALSWNASWWGGESIWETASRAGLRTANLMWPGPPETSTGVRPTYFVPWKDKVPLKEKLDQLMKWIDLPLEERPQLLLAYEPSLDQAGHADGPFSRLVNDTLVYVDRFARDLHLALGARNLTNIVDIIFVSDHGMTDTQDVEFIYMEDLIGSYYVQAIEHEDGWPSVGLRFGPDINTTHVLDLLTASAAKAPEKFSVFTHETMPPNYHFSSHSRIAPIYVIPNIGYALTNRKEGDARLVKGNHGYDNSDPSMYAMFVSDGPFAERAKRRKREQARSAWRRLGRSIRGIYTRNGWHYARETYVMHGFQNLEIYGLVIKLLGIESFAVHTNGTAGFWDQYL